MNDSRPWIPPKRFLQIAYALLWPPLILMATRRSYQPEILGWWSARMFGIMLAAVAVLLLATVVLIRTREDPRGRIWLDWLVELARRHRLLLIVLLAGPPLGWCLLVGYMGLIDVPLSWPLVVCLLDLAALGWVSTAALTFVGRSARRQRLLAMKWTLAAGSLILAILAVEVAAGVLRLSPYGTWELNPKNLDVRFRTDDFDVAVRTNIQGLREAEEAPVAKRARRRIVVVGDSMTFGWGVEAEEAYPRVLEDRLRERTGEGRCEVINMGRPGASPNDYLRYIRHYAVELKPDLIVVGLLIGNDCPVLAPADLRDSQQLEQELASYVDQSRVNGTERLLFRSFLIRTTYARVLPQLRYGAGSNGEGTRGPIFHEPNPLAEASISKEIASSSHPPAAAARFRRLSELGWVGKGLRWDVNPWLVRAIILHPSGAADSLAVRPESLASMHWEWKLCAALLNEMRRSAEECGADFAVLAIPNAHLVSQRWVDLLADLGCETNDAMTSSRVVNDWLRDYAAASGLTLIDPLDRFRSPDVEPASLYLRTDDHMTPAGHRLLGESLAGGLTPWLMPPSGEP